MEFSAEKVLKNHFFNKFHGIFHGKSLSVKKNVRKIGPWLFFHPSSAEPQRHPLICKMFFFQKCSQDLEPIGRSFSDPEAGCLALKEYLHFIKGRDFRKTV
jgi:hypothetical protein